MKIQVTKKDIAQGVRNIPYLCPVALAIGRAFLNSHPSVQHKYVSFRYDSAPPQSLPKSVTRFIRHFDNWPVWTRWFLIRPFSFELRERK